MGYGPLCATNKCHGFASPALESLIDPQPLFDPLELEHTLLSKEMSFACPVSCSWPAADEAPATDRLAVCFEVRVLFSPAGAVAYVALAHVDGLPVAITAASSVATLGKPLPIVTALALDERLLAPLGSLLAWRRSGCVCLAVVL